MRLLKTTKSEEGKFEVKVFTDEQLQDLPYAILSHTWGSDEVTLQDINDPIGKSRMGYKKIEDCCSIARKMEYQYVWIDTCCIDKTSSAELSEAINSMFLWYQEASICYAYLFDSWRELGDKKSLGRRISECTRIPESVLSGEKDINMFSAAQRLSWAAKRETTRVEDRAYCLLGLFGVNMPLIYGERKAAFIRLQEEILKISEDHSLFAWKWKSSDTCSGLLATSPSAFIDSHDIVPCETFQTSSGPLIISGRGIHLDLCLIGLEHAGLALAVLECRRIDEENKSVAIFVHDPSMTLERFKRVNCDKFVHAPKDPEGYHSFLPIQTYPKLKPTRSINWNSPNADVHLWLSIVYGDLEAILNVVSHGRTPLSWAAENGLEKYVTMLIKRGAATELDNDMGYTPLTFAIWADNVPIIEILLDKGANINTEDQYRRTPLVSAILTDNVSIIKMLLDRGADIYTEDQYRRTPLVFAICAGNTSIVKMLLDIGAKMETKSRDGYTPLAYAMLLDKGADINAEDQYRRTPLVFAMLLDNGAKMETKSRDGYTPLAYAMLLDLGANIDTKDRFGYVPLSYAISDDKPIVETMILHGADINAMNVDGETPLSIATRYGQQPIVEMLRKKGAITETAMARLARKLHQGILRLF
ncbi:ankyrin repeat-containing domain protein [Aspergillus sergii]|uniref:Ankyrin repeat-containing domain protein n=1 Tax=Aspergillus sergii TaxID=1034303 RepID=A0A5N6WYV3_9EURO|nr:ankyrin repeat-containing domain protein [Aspergillus sergii]